MANFGSTSSESSTESYCLAQYNRESTGGSDELTPGRSVSNFTKEGTKFDWLAFG